MPDMVMTIAVIAVFLLAVLVLRHASHSGDPSGRRDRIEEHRDRFTE